MADNKTCNIVNDKLKSVEETAKKWLGKTTDYTQKYSPDILLPFSRQDSLESCDIKSDAYMWYGFDLWNLWELRFKLNNNRSIQRIGTLIYDAHSPQIIESKSMKLYFFALDEEKLGNTADIAQQRYLNKAILDLTNKVGTPVDLSVFSYNNSDKIKAPIDVVKSFKQADHTIILDELECEFEFPNPPSDGGVNFDDASLLKVNPIVRESDEIAEPTETTDFLYYAGQSRCLVTGQKDTCVEFIRVEMNSAYALDAEALIKYLQQFESVNRFHESTAHTIFDRILNLVRQYDETANVTVWSLYTRRGGIDINPFRTTDKKLFDYVSNQMKNNSWSKTWNQ